MRFFVITARAAALACLVSGGLFAQASLSLSTAVVSPGLPGDLTLSFNSPETVTAGVGWRLSYDPATISSISIRPGQSALTAGKSLNCSQTDGAMLCLLVGGNQTAIPAGVVAEITATSPAGSAPIGVDSSSAVSGDGAALVLNGQGGGLTSPVPDPAPAPTPAPAPEPAPAPAPAPAPSTQTSSAAPMKLNSITCGPDNVFPGEYSDCLVTVSAAPAQDMSLGVYTGNWNLEVPSSVVLPAGSTTTSLRIRALSPPVTSLAGFTVVLSPENSLTAVVTVNAGLRWR